MGILLSFQDGNVVTKKKSVGKSALAEVFRVD